MVEPVTRHFPRAANETVSPDVALALTRNGRAPYGLSASGRKVIDWPAFATAKLCDTSGAAA
jgi:hypothetical protein